MDDEPRYLGAYPALAMSEVMAKRWRGIWDVVWRNEFHEYKGEGVFIWREFTAESFYKVMLIAYVKSAKGRKHLTIQPKMYGSHSVRLSRLCRTCGAFVGRLFLRWYEWLCKYCHGLRKRSTFMTSTARWTEELSMLCYEIGRGRPVAMTNAAFLKAGDRMRDLELKLGGERRPAKDELRGLI